MKRFVEAVSMFAILGVLAACGGGSSGGSLSTGAASLRIVTVDGLPYLQLPEPDFNISHADAETDFAALAMGFFTEYEIAIDTIVATGINISQDVAAGKPTSNVPKVQTRNEEVAGIFEHCIEIAPDVAPNVLNFCGSYYHPVGDGYVSVSLYDYKPGRVVSGFYSSTGTHAISWEVSVKEGDFGITYGRQNAEGQEFRSCGSSDSEADTWDVNTCAALLRGAIQTFKSISI